MAFFDLGFTLIDNLVMTTAPNSEGCPRVFIISYHLPELMLKDGFYARQVH